MTHDAARFWAERWRLIRLYLELGWALIPLCWPSSDGGCGCGRGHAETEAGKAPLLSHLKLGRVPTPADAEAWFVQWSRANVGVLLGPSRLLVIDLDSRQARTEARSLGHDEGPEVARGPDHHHLYTGSPSDLVGRGIHRGTSGAIDVLGQSGYVVAPPSLHRTGQPYEWVTSPDVIPLPPAPGWAIEILRGSQEQRHAGEADLPDTLPTVDLDTLAISEFTRSLIVDGSKAAPGRFKTRSELVFSVALRLINAGCDDAAVAGVLLDPRYAVSERPRECGRRWVEGELGRARADRGVRPVHPGLAPFPKSPPTRHPMIITVEVGR